MSQSQRFNRRVNEVHDDNMMRSGGTGMDIVEIQMDFINPPDRA